MPLLEAGLLVGQRRGRRVVGILVYVGVTGPLGGINQLFPLFGISSQRLAAIALTLCVTLMFKHGKAKSAWVPGVPLAWDLTTTMTARWQKVFSGDARIGYFEQRSTSKTSMDTSLCWRPRRTWIRCSRSSPTRP